MRHETLPVAVLVCSLSRVTGLTGKEGRKKSWFVSRYPITSPEGFSRCLVFSWLPGFGSASLFGVNLLGERFDWLVCKGEGGAYCHGTYVTRSDWFICSRKWEIRSEFTLSCFAATHTYSCAA